MQVSEPGLPVPGGGGAAVLAAGHVAAAEVALVGGVAAGGYRLHQNTCHGVTCSVMRSREVTWALEAAL